MEIRTDLFLGDSKKMLKKLSDNSVDLIVTSPPYADQRKEFAVALNAAIGLHKYQQTICL